MSAAEGGVRGIRRDVVGRPDLAGLAPVTAPGSGRPSPLLRGSIVRLDLSPTRGREQTGRRPALVVASRGYLDAVTTLVIAVPITTVDHNWPNHVALRGRTGLTRPGWAMTEQPRTVSRDRIERVLGLADGATLADVDLYLRDALGL